MKQAIHTSEIVLCAALFAAGTFCVALPWISARVYEKQADRIISRFQNSHEVSKDEAPQVSDPSEIRPYEELYEAMQEYNEAIAESGQAELVDAWSYEQPSFQLSEWGLEDKILGYVEVSSMDSRLPIYLGASKANMRLGAVHLTQASLPIGGESTNAVLAAHRGYNHIPFWRDIEKVQLGDEVILTNLWETLHYRVVGIEIIDPDEVDKVKIQPGRDLLTLFTCHPYGGHGIYRYVVTCERADTDGAEQEENLPKETEETTKLSQTEIVIESSQPRIQTELFLQKCGMVGVGMTVCLLILVKVSRRRKH